MNDGQLKRNLQSTGMASFVKYFELFRSSEKNNEVANKIRNEIEYTDKSCMSRTSNARSIMRKERTDDALRMIINSEKVNQDTKDKAKTLLNNL